MIGNAILLIYLKGIFVTEAASETSSPQNIVKNYTSDPLYINYDDYYWPEISLQSW